MEDYAGAHDYDRAEYERALKGEGPWANHIHAQPNRRPRRTFQQIVKDEWITVLVVLVIFVIPMLLALKGAIF